MQNHIFQLSHPAWNMDFTRHSIKKYYSFKEFLNVNMKMFCPRTPYPKLSFDFCFLKNGVPKLSPGYIRLTWKPKYNFSNYEFGNYEKLTL